MRQVATGRDGAGYEIVYTAKDMPEELQALRAELMAVPPAERQTPAFKAEAEKFTKGAEAWQKAGSTTVAHLIIDGVFQGEYASGTAARAKAADIENTGRAESGKVFVFWETH